MTSKRYTSNMLSDKERQLLKSRYEKGNSLYQRYIILALCLALIGLPISAYGALKNNPLLGVSGGTLLFLGLLALVGLKSYHHKNNRKLAILDGDDSIEIKKVTGQLRIEKVGKGGGGLLLYVGNTLLPVTNIERLKPYKGQEISVEIIPSLNEVRFYSDGTGKSFNFITNSNGEI